MGDGCGGTFCHFRFKLRFCLREFFAEAACFFARFLLLLAEIGHLRGEVLDLNLERGEGVRKGPQVGAGRESFDAAGNDGGAEPGGAFARRRNCLSWPTQSKRLRFFSDERSSHFLLSCSFTFTTPQERPELLNL